MIKKQLVNNAKKTEIFFKKYIKKQNQTHLLKYIKNGINFTRGTGSSTFSQFSYKLGLEYRLIEYMILRTNYELRYKIIAGNNSNINSMLILNLGYKF